MNKLPDKEQRAAAGFDYSLNSAAKKQGIKPDENNLLILSLINNSN